MTDNKKFKAYFYNGLAEPELIATNSKELKGVAISDNYSGNVTPYLIESINYCNTISELSEELLDYDIYINPTKKDFIEANKAWFDKNSLETYLEKW